MSREKSPMKLFLKSLETLNENFQPFEMLLIIVRLGCLQEFCPKKIQRKLKIKVSPRKIVSIKICTLGILLSSSKYVPPQIYLNLEILLSVFCRLEQFCPICNAYS